MDDRIERDVAYIALVSNNNSIVSIDQLVQTATAFKNRRDTDLTQSKYDEHKIASIAAKNAKAESQGKRIESPTPLTVDQINAFGLSISKEFGQYTNYNPWKKMGLTKMSTGKSTKCTDFLDPVPNNKGDNCQRIYFDCVDKIRNHGFDTYAITKNIKMFSQRVTGCLRDTTVYRFECQKNNYKFVICYLNDNDYQQNPLLISGLTYVPTNTKCDLYCDLLEANKEYPCTDMINLLNTYPDQYISTYFGHFIRIPQLLTKRIDNLQIELPTNTDSLFTNPRVRYANHNDMFWAIIGGVKISCTIEYKSYNCADNDNDMSTDAPKYVIVLKYFDKPKQYGCAANTMHVPYDSDSDIDTLCDSMLSFCYSVTKEYGFQYPGLSTYHNDHTIKQYLDKNSISATSKSCKSKTKTTFEVLATWEPEYNKRVYCTDRYNESKYFDNYSIIFKYDDSSEYMCNLTISEHESQTTFQSKGTYPKCFIDLCTFVERVKSVIS